MSPPSQVVLFYRFLAPQHVSRLGEQSHGQKGKGEKHVKGGGELVSSWMGWLVVPVFLTKCN